MLSVLGDEKGRIPPYSYKEGLASPFVECHGGTQAFQRPRINTGSANFPCFGLKSFSTSALGQHW